jgi:Fe-S-cluster containining protein
MNRRIEEKRSALPDLYAGFESDAAPFKKEAACAKGCSFCCTDAGSIDIVTLEGIAIREAVASMARPRQKTLKKAVEKDVRGRLQGRRSACPFLLKNRSCAVYPVRPFSCRRIFSLHPCSRQRPPILHRTAMERAEETIRALQRLDDTGYSGHISVVLNLLEDSDFLAVYRSGDFRPERVAAYGKRHGMRINRSKQ